MRFDSELSNAFENGIFAIKATQGEGLKILTAQKRFERLPISFAQVKADNTSGNLWNELRKTICSLHQTK